MKHCKLGNPQMGLKVPITSGFMIVLDDQRFAPAFKMWIVSIRGYPPIFR